METVTVQDLILQVKRKMNQNKGYLVFLQKKANRFFFD